MPLLNCIHCGAVFFTTHVGDFISRASYKVSPGKYCSHKCRVDSQREARTRAREGKET